MKQFTDEEKKILAEKLGVGINEIDELQEYANQKWHLAVYQDTETEKYVGALYYRHDKPSGSERWLILKSTKTQYDTLEQATIAANEIPEMITLATLQAEFMEVPENIFLLLERLSVE